MGMEYPSQPPLSPPPAKSNTRTIVIIVVVLLVLCCCCTAAGIYVAWNYGDEFVRQFNLSQILGSRLPLA